MFTVLFFLCLDALRLFWCRVCGANAKKCIGTPLHDVFPVLHIPQVLRLPTITGLKSSLSNRQARRIHPDQKVFVLKAGVVHMSVRESRIGPSVLVLLLLTERIVASACHFAVGCVVCCVAGGARSCPGSPSVLAAWLRSSSLSRLASPMTPCWSVVLCARLHYRGPRPSSLLVLETSRLRVRRPRLASSLLVLATW